MTQNFAYIGTKRIPSKFIAAIAIGKRGYGTLINTNLIEGSSAITLPESKYMYKKKQYDNFISSINAH